MKALILAAGRGSRLNEITKNRNKCILNVLEKPTIEHNLERATNIDEINEIIIIVGWKPDDIINRYGNEFRGKKISYVFQNEQQGLVHAIETAKEKLNGEDFFLLLGDEIIAESTEKEMVKKFKEENLFAVCGVIKQSNRDHIRKTYSVIVDENKNIFRLIEKPRKPLNEYQGTGHCIFKNQILDLIKYTPIHHERKEKELPDLIQCAIDDGEKVKIHVIGKNYVNTNTENDLETAKNILQN
jgi:UDP-N-acetylglucosamine diphosphorylase / glucose-1-phosphate thymidylyltransferase / UDP-N-acetylgalactosamine diphosphorylase / glucosamine-1-phosphate N-acetyltransferase / galactosamine-1-phosphate N-acetyltransferase